MRTALTWLALIALGAAGGWLARGPADDAGADPEKVEFNERVRDWRLQARSQQQQWPILTCNLVIAEDRLSGRIYLPSAPRLPTYFFTNEAGDFSLLVPPDSTSGELIIAGHAPRPVQWSVSGLDAHCTESPIELVPGEMVVRGRVVNSDGHPEPHATVSGCGDPGLTQEAEFWLSGIPSACELIATTNKGHLLVESDPVSVEFSPGSDLFLELVVRESTGGGIGLTGSQSHDGFAVLSVAQGSPSQLAGIAEGDIITEIDGVDATLMGSRDFERRLSGASGEPIVLVVKRDGGTPQTHRLTRAPEQTTR